MPRGSNKSLILRLQRLNDMAIREYRLDHAYGGYKLVVIEENGGQREITPARLTNRVMAETLDILIGFARAETEQEGKSND